MMDEDGRGFGSELAVGGPWGTLSPRPPGIYRFRLAPSKEGEKQAGRRRPA